MAKTKWELTYGTPCTTSRNKCRGGKKTKLKKEQIQELGDGVFAVQSQSDETQWYSVNMFSGFCECLGGRNCAPCVHKHSIAQHFKTSMFSALPSMDPNMRAMCHLIATGKKEDPTWYRTPENQEPNVDQFIEDYEAKFASEIQIQ